MVEAGARSEPESTRSVVDTFKSLLLGFWNPVTGNRFISNFLQVAYWVLPAGPLSNVKSPAGRTFTVQPVGHERVYEGVSISRMAAPPGPSV
jgi:hypothetical protein